MHRERMKNIRSMVDTSEPFANQLDHVRNNLKREQQLEERYSEIDRENRILLNKMSTIMKQQPPLTDRTHDRQRGQSSLNRDVRKKELHRITHENQQILRRIQQAQPVYNHVAWEGDHRRNLTYLQNCAEYPLVLRKPSPRRPTSELVPLATPRQEDRSVAETMPSRPIVFKDGMRMGPDYYLVEMATDGRSLDITAYEGNTQTTLSLLVREPTHRRLLRECGGDYQRIACRLHIESGRLSLDDPSIKVAEHKSAPPRPKNGWVAPEELDAEEMVIARASPDSAGSAYAQVDFNNTDEVQVRFRGFTPNSRRASDIDVEYCE